MNDSEEKRNEGNGNEEESDYWKYKKWRSEAKKLRRKWRNENMWKAKYSWNDNEEMSCMKEKMSNENQWREGKCWKCEEKINIINERNEDEELINSEKWRKWKKKSDMK